MKDRAVGVECFKVGHCWGSRFKKGRSESSNSSQFYDEVSGIRNSNGNGESVATFHDLDKRG